MPLTAKQLHHIEDRLLEERTRVVRELDGFMGDVSEDDRQERTSDLSKVPTHPADLGSDLIDDEIEMSIASRKSRELTEIDDALNRLAGDPEHFGLDEESGAQIPFARLEIIPWARTGVPEDVPADAQR